MIRVQVLIKVPESEVGRVEPLMSARLPQEWRYVSHRRVSRSSHSRTETREPENTGAPAHPMPTDPSVVTAVPHQQPETNAVDAWADSVLGGLEDHPPCQHCLMGPCITVSEVTRIQGSCAPDITNHSKRHKNYRKFWKSLKDRGLWQHELYIHRKTSAGLSEVELRELMPQCVLDDTRKRYPNPPGVPYMGHKRS